jgi:hypothetical protein
MCGQVSKYTSQLEMRTAFLCRVASTGGACVAEQQTAVASAQACVQGAGFDGAGSALGDVSPLASWSPQTMWMFKVIHWHTLVLAVQMGLGIMMVMLLESASQIDSCQWSGHP